MPADKTPTTSDVNDTPQVDDTPQLPSDENQNEDATDILVDGTVRDITYGNDQTDDTVYAAADADKFGAIINYSQASDDVVAADKGDLTINRRPDTVVVNDDGVDIDKSAEIALAVEPAVLRRPDVAPTGDKDIKKDTQLVEKDTQTDTKLVEKDTKDIKLAERETKRDMGGAVRR